MKKFITVMSKFLEIFFVIFALAAAVFAVMSAVNPDFVYSILKPGLDSSEMTVLGFGTDIVNAAGSTMKAPMVILFAFSIITSLCMTMIFRNIYLIYKTAEGKTWFSKGETPFQKDIVRMVREVGIFSIAIPVVQIIASLIIKMITHLTCETHVFLTGLIFGFVVVSISQFFAYGEKLESDVEGLV